ncbi:hypothetical protein FNV43_RR19166 [Rhamnella rubrinervis]|uniref:DNA mismatch repair protein MLH3 n=1 Tax=Rhamnella rubrinervis TaxID=2594499 RepID=A0A8K0E7P6_9ROSA|nr:hypothetical protein FNV43_RR19166 [Rhamnella rubrinervis]
MRSINSLPEAVRSSVRSGIILFDLTRVVEELIFNSLDAGASKVSVFVGVGTFYVKVVDDGSGITRDGLALLGERYVTSKFDHLAGKDATTGSLGFRGEALASISDVSLLDIETKAHGRPNGYRKVMKGSKCLYLEIDDERKDVGTTVVVRDLFYNQPVRRKYIQSSEGVLLCTNLSSPLALLTSGFGIDVSASLHELNTSDGKLKLSGYVSGPSDDFAIKVEGFMLIMMSFNMSVSMSLYDCWDQARAVRGSQNKKRKRPQSYPAFILNLCCPQSLYDLTFEPSKTYVTFKDWVPVLTFISEAVENFWKENISYGESVCNAADTVGKDQMWNRGDNIVPAARVGIVHHIENSFQLWDGSLAKCMSKASGRHENSQCNSNNKFSSAEDYFLENRVTAAESSNNNVEDNNFSFSWGNGSSEFDISVSYGSARSAVPCDTTEVSDDLEMNRVTMEPFLKSCSAHGRLPREGALFTDDELDFRSDGFRTKQILSVPYEWDDIPEADSSDQSFNFLSKTSWQDQAPAVQPFPRVLSKSDFYAQFDCLPRYFVKSTPSYEEHLGEENDYSYDSVQNRGNIGPGHLTLQSKWFSETSDPLSQATSWDLEHYTDIDMLEESSRSVKRASNKHFLDGEEMDYRFDFGMKSNSSNQENCPTCIKHGLDYASSSQYPQRFNLNNKISLLCPDTLTDEKDLLSCDSHGKDHTHNGIYESQRDCSAYSHRSRKYHSSKERTRSHSAPPFYRSKRKFSALNYPMTVKTGEVNILAYPEAGEMKQPYQSAGIFHQHLKPSTMEDEFLDTRSQGRHQEDSKDDKLEESLYFDFKDTAPVKEIISKEYEDSLDSWTKWRNCHPQIANNNKLNNVHNQSDILDISSGFLHLAADSLVPNSINKNSLENAQVLQQVDKKFIPILAGRTLAVIDQHAADERIRLEELRQKVLSGEAKTITFLDAEQELMLPEIGYQLLHNYAESVKEWGWICNIHAHDSRPFKRNLNLLHGQPTVVTLLAVPCILGVNLSDVDLMEFLQQLTDTDGSSMMPPSVLRILNSKACRGAIMFGDSLLPSECSLIVEELKQTSLCFQCAHGRPTTVPLVNMEALHKHIAKVSSLNEASIEMWHGLRRHELSLERATHRLRSATTC